MSHYKGTFCEGFGFTVSRHELNQEKVPSMYLAESLDAAQLGSKWILMYVNDEWPHICLLNKSMIYFVSYQCMESIGEKYEEAEAGWTSFLTE